MITNDNKNMDINDTIIINVSGQHHEIMRSTINSKKTCLLSDNTQMELHYRKDKQEYYFDRHPRVFLEIVNYLRTGELHAPQDVCGPVFRQELIYWGINEYELQQCCWIRYCSDIDTQSTLKGFEKGSAIKINKDLNVSKWEKFRNKAWLFLENPYSSVGAKIYACFSLLFILTSIATFCAATHPSLRSNLTTEQYAEYYNKDPKFITNQGGHFFIYDDMFDYEYPNESNGSSDYARTKRSINNDSNVKPDGKQTKKTKANMNLFTPNPTLDLVNIVCMSVFTLEILVRFILCPNKLKFFINTLNIIDLLAILPFYIELIVQRVYKNTKYEQSFVDMLFLLQILRIIRIFRLMRHVKGLQVLVYTITHSWKEMLLMLIFLIIGMLLFGSLIYYTEYNAESKGRVTSIPHGFWWALVTMTTVGYGDTYPVTNWGYVVGSFCTVTGVLVIAFSIPGLVNNFMLFYSYIQYEKNERKICQEKEKLCKLVRKVTPKEQHLMKLKEAKTAVLPVSQQGNTVIMDNRIQATGHR